MSTPNTMDVLTVGLVILGLYLMIDAMTTNNPARRRRDERDLRIIGEGASVFKNVL